jgi:hypothetical protein
MRKAGVRNGRIEAKDKNGWRRIPKRPTPTQGYSATDNNSDDEIKF